MSEYGLRDQIDLNGSLMALPGAIFQKIADKLDNNPPDCNWEALLRVVEDNYKISSKDILLLRKPSNGIMQSSATRALTMLNGQGMVVSELADYLDKIHIDTFPFGLSPYESIIITQMPTSVLDVTEGDLLVIEVKATGRPYPRFQWFFCKDGTEAFERLPGRTDGLLQINKVTFNNAGTYSCQIHNCDDPEKTVLTDFTLVTVTPQPYSQEPIELKGKTGFEDHTVVNMLRNLGPISPENRDFHGDLYKRSTRPIHLITRQPQDVTVSLNEPIEMSIETCGNPPIMYQWFRNNQPIDVRSHKLYIPHARVQDYGAYHCVVKDGNTTDQSHIAHVKETIPDSQQMAETADIVLIAQPKSVQIQFGGSVIFSCEAKCCLPLHYQWFKDGEPLPGETSSELKFFNIQESRYEGTYQCEVSVNRPNCNIPRRLTSVAVLKVEVPRERKNIEFNPSDKVALLIGNYDYRNEQRLNAPSSDVQVLSEIFRSLQFKVVSLLNLTKTEIENAVEEFCHLVEENVYAVFYFCGHGFEEFGVSYLVPTDAPAAYRAEECVRADLVLENIQRKEPPLILMILDICRRGNKVKSDRVPYHIPQRQTGNTVFCYATSQDLNAYEDKQRGLLVRHLEPILRRPIGVDHLIIELKAEFNRQPKHKGIQIPELQSNLLEPDRSLADKISIKGQTQAFQRRQLIWNKAHVKPNKQSITFNEVGVQVELDYQSDFSNVLNIFATIVNKGMTSSCRADIKNIPLTVSTMNYKACQQGDTVITVIAIQDIQKLQTDLIVDLCITFKMKGTDQVYLRKTPLNLGMPLVSILKLCRPSTNHITAYRQPTEQAEDYD